jgi:hypothetical protein
LQALASNVTSTNWLDLLNLSRSCAEASLLKDPVFRFIRENRRGLRAQLGCVEKGQQFDLDSIREVMEVILCDL